MSGPSTSAVLYEVNIDLAAEARAEYLAWLEKHVAEIRALPGFTGAEVFEVTDPPPAEGRVSLCTQYRLVEQTALASYLRDHAPGCGQKGSPGSAAVSGPPAGSWPGCRCRGTDTSSVQPYLNRASP